jgi:hypothetical protein
MGHHFLVSCRSIACAANVVLAIEEMMLTEREYKQICAAIDCMDGLSLLEYGEVNPYVRKQIVKLLLTQWVEDKEKDALTTES